MKYSLDCEFIDTPACSDLISLGLVREDGDRIYFEFAYPREHITPWLRQNVVPHLTGFEVSFYGARIQITEFIGEDIPEIWCYYGAYDWYWFCRIFGGFMNMNQRWPHRFRELADYTRQVRPRHGPEHHALNDALSQMDVMREVKIIS